MKFLNKILSKVKPIEHFSGEWSLETWVTHGNKSIVKVQKTELESERLKKGGDDIYRGTKQGLLAYIKKTYPETRTIKFV